jgi:hypothetical protein
MATSVWSKVDTTTVYSNGMRGATIQIHIVITPPTCLCRRFSPSQLVEHWQHYLFDEGQLRCSITFCLGNSQHLEECKQVRRGHTYVRIT